MPPISRVQKRIRGKNVFTQYLIAKKSWKTNGLQERKKTEHSVLSVLKKGERRKINRLSSCCPFDSCFFLRIHRRSHTTTTTTKKILSKRIILISSTTTTSTLTIACVHKCSVRNNENPTLPENNKNRRSKKRSINSQYFRHTWHKRLKKGRRRCRSPRARRGLSKAFFLL